MLLIACSVYIAQAKRAVFGWRSCPKERSGVALDSEVLLVDRYHRDEIPLETYNTRRRWKLSAYRSPRQGTGVVLEYRRQSSFAFDFLLLASIGEQSNARHPLIHFRMKCGLAVTETR